jgi:cytochrome c
MNVSKKWGLLLGLTVLAAACGQGSDKPAASGAAAAGGNGSGMSTADSDKALELIGTNDCKTCHRIHASDEGVTTGPAYSQVADKYSPAADTTVDRLVKKVQTGGAGFWGTIPMTPHTMVPEADIRLMVKYILSLKK